MSETWDEAVERAISDAPEGARRAWQKLRSAEAAALEKGARLIAAAEAEDRAKPPEKLPEVEAPKDTGTAFGEIYQALDTVKAALAAGRAAEDRLLERRREVEALRRELSQFDCQRTGGPVSDSGGKHCPQEAPCLTCRLERAEERARKAEAEVARLAWEESGAPMLGEHSGHPSTCPACRDGYPPPPGQPTK